MSFVDFSPRDGYKAPTNTCAHPWKTLLSMAGVRLSMDAKDPRVACITSTFFLIAVAEQKQKP